jgi:hypothetical protein
MEGRHVLLRGEHGDNLIPNFSSLRVRLPGGEVRASIGPNETRYFRYEKTEKGAEIVCRVTEIEDKRRIFCFSTIKAPTKAKAEWEAEEWEEVFKPIVLVRPLPREKRVVKY